MNKPFELRHSPRKGLGIRLSFLINLPFPQFALEMGVKRKRLLC